MLRRLRNTNGKEKVYPLSRRTLPVLRETLFCSTSLCNPFTFLEASTASSSTLHLLHEHTVSFGRPPTSQHDTKAPHHPPPLPTLPHLGITPNAPPLNPPTPTILPRHLNHLLYIRHQHPRTQPLSDNLPHGRRLSDATLTSNISLVLSGYFNITDAGSGETQWVTNITAIDVGVEVGNGNETMAYTGNLCAGFVNNGVSFCRFILALPTSHPHRSERLYDTSADWAAMFIDIGDYADDNGLCSGFFPDGDRLVITADGFMGESRHITHALSLYPPPSSSKLNPTNILL